MHKPRISLIVALSENRVIGNKGEIPWRIPGEQKRFKEITMPHPMIMGRKTFESIGRILPGRPHIIVTRQENYTVDGATVVNTLEKAIEVAQEMDQDEVFVIGGGEIFKEAMPVVDRLYLTIIHKTIEGDAYFPAFAEFTKVLEKEDRTFEDVSYTYLTLER